MKGSFMPDTVTGAFPCVLSERYVLAGLMGTAMALLIPHRILAQSESITGYTSMKSDWQSD